MTAGMGDSWEVAGVYRTFKYSHRSREVIDSSRRPERSDNDGRGRHEIVCKGVVEVALQFEDVLHLVELLLVPSHMLDAGI